MRIFKNYPLKQREPVRSGLDKKMWLFQWCSCDPRLSRTLFLHGALIYCFRAFCCLKYDLSPAQLE